MWFDQQKVGAEAALFDKNLKAVLCVRAIPPQEGKLDLPGGFVEVDETAEAALMRELREEIGATGDVLEDVRYIRSATNSYEYEGREHPVLVLQFAARLVGRVEAGAEVSEVIMSEVSHLAPDDMAWPDLHLPLLSHVRSLLASNGE